MTPGPTNSITDIKGLKVGNAQDDTLKSGTTVLTADAPFVASVHVMGGAPGTRETDLLDPDKSVAAVDALVLSGGSAYGLDACSGVVDGLRAQGRGYKVGAAIIPLVPGAILFDLLNGGQKDWADNPYRALGRQAFEAASTSFDIGSMGAGTGALTATMKGGLGTASFVLEDGTTVAALVGANPMGSVTTPSDKHFWGAAFEMNAEFGGAGPDPSSELGRSLTSRKVAAMMAAEAERANTTIAIVATDAPLSKSQCKRVAIASHDGIGRAVVPAHAPVDGDLVFALSTQTGEADDRTLAAIGHAGALCLSRAIGRAIYNATPAAGDLLPCWTDLNGDKNA
jgi:D-aminopeptidase